MVFVLSDLNRLLHYMAANLEESGNVDISCDRSLKLNIPLRRGARTESGALNAHNSVRWSERRNQLRRTSDMHHEVCSDQETR